MVENVLQIKSARNVNADVSVEIWKNIICVKKLNLGSF